MRWDGRGGQVGGLVSCWLGWRLGAVGRKLGRLAAGAHGPSHSTTRLLVLVVGFVCLFVVAVCLERSWWVCLYVCLHLFARNGHSPCSLVVG